MLLSIFLQALLLCGAVAQAVEQPKDNLEKIWDIDESCNDHKNELKEAYHDAVIMVRSALRDLAQLDKAPPLTKNRSFGDYARAKRLIYFLFGIKIGDEEHEDEEYLEAVERVFREMNTAFTEGVPRPDEGYSGKVDKPLLLCGQKMWEWLDLDDTDPLDPAGRKLSESQAQVIENLNAREDADVVGAWSYTKKKLVMFKRQKRDDAGICPPGVTGKTSIEFDWLTICDTVFESESWTTSKSAVERGPQIVANDKVALSDFGPTLSQLLIHEFAHYYSGRRADTSDPQVIDVQAVNEEGQLLWTQADYSVGTENTGVQFGAYGMDRIMQLAKARDDNQDSGPAKTIENADTFAYYAIAAYLKKWEWPMNGRPKALPEQSEQGKLPWNDDP